MVTQRFTQVHLILQAFCWLSISRAGCEPWKPAKATLCLILPVNPSAAKIRASFETIVNESSIDGAPAMELDAITLFWRQENRSLFQLTSTIQSLIDSNVTGVISFLPVSQNQPLLSLLSGTLIPVVGIENDPGHHYGKGARALEQRMYVSIQAPDALQATVVKDLLLEFEENRFICITTNATRTDPFWSQLFRHVRNTAEPRCIIIPEEHEASAVERLSASLKAIATSRSPKIIVVHCAAQEAKTALAVARELNSTPFADDFVWMFSGEATDNIGHELPDGALGISKLPPSEEFHNQAMEDAFLEDSVQVFTKALAMTVLKNGSTHIEHVAAFRRRLYREILGGSFTGVTGPIEFNTKGERSTYKFIISKVMKSLKEGLQWQAVGSSVARWELRESSPCFETFLPRHLPQPRHLRVVTIEHEPFTIVRQALRSSKIMEQASCPVGSVLCTRFTNSTQLPRLNHTDRHSQLCCYGAVIEMLLNLQQLTGFTFTLSLVSDGKYGSYDPETREMNGMIGELARRKADLAVGIIRITEERSKIVDFTIPYRQVFLTFLVKSSKKRNYSFVESISDMRLMKPFGPGLWLACVATFIVVSLTVYLMEKFARYRGVHSSYLLPFEFTAYVFGNIFHVPLTQISARTFAVPIVMVIANCGALVLVSSYTANLLVSLIVLEETSIVSGVFDAKLTSPPVGFTFGAVRNSSTEDFFRKSSNPRLRRIYDNMKSVNDKSEGMRQIQSGDLTVFITESTTLVAGENCQFKLDGNRFDLAGLAFALPKNSQWTNELSRAVHKLKSRDRIERIFNKWRWAGCEARDDSAPDSMGLDEFGGFLFNTFVICFGCFFILSLEILIHKINRNRKQLNFWKETSLQPMRAVATKLQYSDSTTTIVPPLENSHSANIEE